MSRELFIFFYSRKASGSELGTSLVQFYGIPTKLVRYW